MTRSPRVRRVGVSHLRTLVAIGAQLAALAVPSSPAGAQVADPNFWVADGDVIATALSGNTLYVGGSFTRLGPQLGNLIPIDAASGAAVAGWPKVNGSIRAVTSDLAGGWYIGGSFTRVGGQPRSNLAHIRADRSVDPWNPGTDDFVFALAVSGTTVYAGGLFTQAGGQARSRLAAIDAAVGAATSWDPSPDGAVYTLATSGSTVYVGGAFSSIGGSVRNKVAAIDAATGQATGWDAQLGAFDPGVYTLAVSGTTIFLGGGFTQAGGQTRVDIAAVDSITGAATAFDPSADGYVFALVVTGSTVYAAGNFSTIGGQPRSYLAELDVATGAATPWNPSAVGSFGSILALAVTGSSVYAGGFFDGLGGQPRSNLAAIDRASGLATGWDPYAFGGVFALGSDGSIVFAGGDVSSVGGLVRERIAAIDVTTGMPTSWNPGADNGVVALAAAGSTLYAGGLFTSIGGQSRSAIAALDAATGLATAWDPSVSGGFPTAIRALVVHGNTVFVGGDFSSAGGQPRRAIAALDTATGLAAPWDPNPNSFSTISDVAADGTSVYAVGDFSTIGGQPRSGVAQLNATTGLATSWNPSPSVFSLRSLAVTPSTVYVGGYGAEAYDVASGSTTGWSPNPFGQVDALVVDGATVYAGGSFSTIDSQARERIAALDSTTGQASAWNPSANDSVLTLTLDATRVYAGGDFNAVGETPARGIAAIYLSCGAPVVYYRDADADGFGDSSVTRFTCDGSPPAGYVANASDCDDHSAAIHPGASDATCDGVDENCNGLVDEGFPGVCQCPTPGPGLVGYWPGDGTPFDVQGGNNGTLVGGASFVAGQVGQAFQFDGINDYVGGIGTASSYSFIQNTGVFTIAAWIKLDDPSALVQEPITGNSGTSTAKGHGFLWENSDGLNRLRVFVTNGTPGVPVIDSSSGINAITTTGWHHVAAVGDGIHVTFWIDGVGTPGSGAFGTMSTGDSTNPDLSIGSVPSVEPFKGRIDEVQIYNRALGAGAIQALYAYGSQPCHCTDRDADGYGAEGGLTCPAGTQVDCDDGVLAVHPGAPDATCNGVDDNCNGQTDEAFGDVCQCSEVGSGLVSWWPGDGNTSDIRGGHNGTLENGASYAPGKVGQAFSLDGINDYVGEIGAASTYSFIQNTGVFSIAAWIKIDDPTVLAQYAVTGNISGSGQKGHIFRWDNTDGLGRLNMHVARGNSGEVGISATSGAHVITTTGWHHVAAVGDGLHVTFWVDGVGTVVPDVFGTLSTGDSSLAYLSIGDCDGSGQCLFKGQIDDVQIYDRALGGSEIQAIYASPSVGMCHCTDADGDGYGAESGLSCARGTLADCDDANVTVWNPPVEVGNLRLASPLSTSLTWAEQASIVGPGVTYDVLRGAVSTPVGSGSDVCYGSAITVNSAMDAAIPAVGTGYRYLVRGHNSCGAGTYGNRSNGAPRVSGVCP